MYLNILALQICWFAGLLIYLSSEYQSVLSTSMRKIHTWPICILGVIIANELLSLNLHRITAAVMVCAGLMTAWIILALTVPQIKKTYLVVPVGSAIVFLLSLMGG